jgi:prolyl oligopeptidase PreP (S9A serine peptidase family)
MDIQHLVDRLEDLIDEGRHMPFSKYTMIDEERALEIIDQMRISIPEEIEKASRVLTTRDRVLAQANEEAARVVQVARQRSEHLIEQEPSVQAARNRAANIIEQARQEADVIIAEADKYVLDELTDLEQHLMKTLAVVRNGIREVNQTVQSNATQPVAAQVPPQNLPQSHPMPQQPAVNPAPAAPQYAPRETVDVDVDAGGLLKK